VNFTPGFSYSYNLSNTDSLGRQLTEGAAFLYYEFAKGTLTGYVYNNAAQRQTDAGLLQAAIWWLQGKQTYSDGDYTVPTISNNIFYKLAITTLAPLTPRTRIMANMAWTFADVGRKKPRSKSVGVGARWRHDGRLAWNGPS